MSEGMQGLPWRSPEQMYAELDPVIRTEVRIFFAVRRLRNMDAQDEADVINNVWLDLIKDDYAQLRRWEPARGSMKNFVRIKTISKLKDHKRKADGRGHIAPTTSLDRDPRPDPSNPELDALSQDIGQQVDLCVRSKLAEKPLHMRLYVRGFLLAEDPEVVRQALGLDKPKQFRLRHEIKRIRIACWQAIVGKR